jgi:hypothetical protein
MKTFYSNLQIPLRLVITLTGLMLSSCYSYRTQEKALVQNVDVDQTLLVAMDEIKKTDMAQSLSIWILKDQVITPQQAKVISELYLSNLNRIVSPFNIWHAAWTISNLYRFGNEEVKAELEEAYQIAKNEPNRIPDEDDFKGAAIDHINGKQMTTGFIHFGGLFYAYGHLVVPGNKNYIQSYQEYLDKQAEQ